MKISKIKSITTSEIVKRFIRCPIIVIKNSNLIYHNLTLRKLNSILYTILNILYFHYWI